MACVNSQDVIIFGAHVPHEIKLFWLSALIRKCKKKLALV